MNTISAVETFDGRIHRTQQEARHHLEKLLGDVMLPLAGRLAQAEKYTKIADMLNSETETLRAIVQIQDDMKLEASED
jgi:hypothetical protein